MAEDTIKIQPDNEEVGQPQIEKKDEATDEFILPTQEQIGEMDAEQLREIYPKLVDKYVEGKKMDTAAHYRNTEVARREEAVRAEEERIREHEREFYNKKEELLNKQTELTFNALHPQATQPVAPDPIADPDGYMKYLQKQRDDEREANKIYRTEQDAKMNDMQTQISAQRIESWVEKNITSKPEFDMVDPLDIELHFRKNPQARSEYSDIMRVATDIQTRKNAVIDAKVQERLNAKAEAAKNAPIEPQAQYGAQKPVKWEKLSDEQEDAELKRLIDAEIKRGGGLEPF